MILKKRNKKTPWVPAVVCAEHGDNSNSLHKSLM